MNRLVLLILLLSLFQFGDAQTTTDITSTEGYTVHVTLGPISIVPNDGCMNGVYNVNVPYNVTFTGTGNLYVLQGTIDCSSASGIYFALPTTAGSGISIASNAYSGGNNQCGSVTCSTIHLTINGQGIPNQTIDINTALPIGLAYFNVIGENKIAKITWEAYQVISIGRVELQKSMDLNDWMTIKAYDHINQNKLITFQDAYQAGNKVYYRLKIIDLNGSIDYSAIRSLKMADTNNWSIYPNPVRSTIFLTQVDPNAIVLVKDLSGRTLLSRINGNRNNLDISSLKSGMYLVSVDGTTKKLIKMD